MRNASLLGAVVLTASVATAGCGAGGPGSDESVAVAGDEPLVDWDTFRASARALPNGSLLVEWDLVFDSEEDLYDYWRTAFDGSRREALTVNRATDAYGITTDDIWDFSHRFHLTYCVANGFTQAQTDQLLPTLDAASRAWSQFLAVRFERVTVSGTCDRYNNEVLFNVEPASYTSMDFPSRDRSKRRLTVDNEGTDNQFDSVHLDVDLLGALTHELGHALGFQHEHIWNPTCGADDPYTGLEQYYSRQLTPYDQMSVMNYPSEWCRNPMGGGYHIDTSDVYGSVSVYGLAPALDTTIVSAYLL